MHQIATDMATGQAARFLATANGVAPIWANLGQIVDKAKTAEEALKLAHLDFTLADAPIYTHWTRGGLSQNEYHGIARAVPNLKSIVRLDTKEALGVVGKDFSVMQPVDAFRFLDSLAENGDAHYISAGLLDDARMFILMGIEGASIEVTDGDKQDVYAMFATGFTGAMARTTKTTLTRVECANTMAIALGDGRFTLKIKNTKNANARMNEARNLLTGVRQDAKSIEEKLRLLAKRRLTKESMTAILDRIFPVNKDAENQTRRTGILADVLSLYEANDKNRFVEQRGTAYNLLNAVTQYVDHARASRSNGHTAEYKRSESALFGSGERMKVEAFDVILNMTDGTETVRTDFRYVPETPADLLTSIVEDSNPV